MSRSKRFAVFATASKILTATAILLATPGAQATLVGVVVGGELAREGSATVGVPFESPAKVEAGLDPEFSGTVEVGGEVLDVSVNLFAESFVIDAFIDGRWGTSVSDGFSVLLTDLAWLGSSGVITNVTPGLMLGDTAAWDLTNAGLIKFDADSIGIQLLLTRPASGRASFEFDISVDHVVVPEPATAALLFFGLAGMRSRRRAAL
jgi:hypothetical protein